MNTAGFCVKVNVFRRKEVKKKASKKT